MLQQQVRTRMRGVAETKYRLTVEELELFVNQLDMLPAKVSGQETVIELLEHVQVFQKDARKLLDMEKPGAKDIEKCVEVGVGLDVELPELEQLRSKQKTTEWLEEVQELMDEPGETSFDQMKDVLQAGAELPSNSAVEKALANVSGLLTQADSWEDKAKLCLSAKPRWTMSDVEKLVREGETVSNGLPSLNLLKEALRKAKDWWAKADSIRSNENLPYIETLEALVAKGRPLPIKLEHLSNLETQVASARAWRERTARVFLKKNSHMALLDVLSPRIDIGENKRRRKIKEEGVIPHPIFQHFTPKELADPKNFVQAYKDADKEAIEVRKIILTF